MEAEQAGAGKWSSAFAHGSTAGMQAYQDALVGAMFIPWGEYLLDTLAVSPGQHLLDVATGPGTVARLASARLGPDGSILAVDLSEAMLAIARSKGPVPDGATIEYRQSSASPLDAPSNAFDVVTCQHGFQFFPDRPAAAAEMRRSLRQGGRLGLAVWAGIDLCPPFAAMRDAVNQVMGSDMADRYAGGPWGLHNPELLAEEVTGAGFNDVSVEEARLPVRFEAGAKQLDHSLAASGIATDVADLPDDQRAALAEAINEHLLPLTDSSGSIVSHVTSQILTATAA
jgi:SAM-dependent methyltransferase